MTGPTRPAPAPQHSRRRVLIASIGAFLVFLDATIVNTAFPDIARSFPGAGRGDLSWVLDAYFIVMAALLVPAGAIADRVGRRRTFVASVVGFAAASVACAAAPSLELLVAGRVVQGAAAAVLAPASLALVLDAFPPARRATGVGIWGAAAALAAASGPALGGLLVEGAGWRWVFLVNIPLGAALVVASRRGLPETRAAAAGAFPDLLGSALAALGLGALALGIVEGEHWGWDSAGVLSAFGAAAALLAAFVHRCAVHPRPVISPSLMRIPAFRRSNAGTLLFSMAFFSVILGNILFLTSVWGYSVLEAGFAVVPGPLTSAAAAAPAGRLADRLGHRAVILPGVVAYAAGLLVLRGAGTEPDYLGTWLPGMLLTGLGVGLAFPALGSAGLAGVDVDQYASASAVSSAFRQFGAVLGTALLVAIVGEPASIGQADAAAGDAYAFAIVAALLSGLPVLRLQRQAATAAPAGAVAAAPEALVAPESRAAA